MGWTLPSTGMWRGEVFAISDCLVSIVLERMIHFQFRNGLTERWICIHTLNIWYQLLIISNYIIIIFVLLIWVLEMWALIWIVSLSSQFYLPPRQRPRTGDIETSLVCLSVCLDPDGRSHTWYVLYLFGLLIPYVDVGVLWLLWVLIIIVEMRVLTSE